MPSAGRNFEDYVHIPIVLVLLVVLWGMISIRVRGAQNMTAGWRSVRIASAFFIILTGVLCTLYFALICAIYIVAHKVTAVHGGPLFGADYPVVDPHTFTEEQVDHIRALLLQGQSICIAARFTLILGLWSVKIAFICIFLEVLEFLGSRTKAMVQATALFILITLLLGLWVLAKDFAVTMALSKPPAELIRSGATRGGIVFVGGNADVEFTLTIFNILTDLLLVGISFQVYNALRFPLSAGLLVFIMVIVTVIIATIRLIIVGLLFSKSEILTSLQYNLNIALLVLSEFETFVGAILSCLPGLRAYIRSREEGGGPSHMERSDRFGSDDMGNLRFNTSLSLSPVKGKSSGDSFP